FTKKLMACFIDWYGHLHHNRMPPMIVSSIPDGSDFGESETLAMSDEAAFLQALDADPEDLTLRMVFADWLEERGDPRGELLRLTHLLTQAIDVPGRAAMEARLQTLV